MDSIHLPSWSLPQKHGGPAHRATTTTNPPISKPTHGMGSDSDSSDDEDIPVPTRELDRGSAIILGILAFLCIAAVIWFYIHRTRIQRQLAQTPACDIEPGGRQDAHINSASTSLEMKSRSERTASAASNNSDSTNTKPPKRQFSWPSMPFPVLTESAVPRPLGIWGRQDSTTSTLTLRPLNERHHHECGRHERIHLPPRYAHYGSRIGYSNLFPPLASTPRRFSVPDPRARHEYPVSRVPRVLPPVRDTPRHSSLPGPRRDPVLSPAGVERTQSRPVRGSGGSRSVYDWTRPRSPPPSRPGGGGDGGVAQGGG